MLETVYSMVKWRIVVSTLALLILFVFGYFYEEVRGPLEGNAAVLQLEDSNTSYVAGRTISNGGISKIVNFSSIGFLAIIWISFLWSGVSLYSKKEKVDAVKK